VSHNKVTDNLDTGEPRQRDVWIEASQSGTSPELTACGRNRLSYSFPRIWNS
jgi:hypothetical protein